jgi:ribosomal protein S12 methylthiotransferase
MLGILANQKGFEIINEASEADVIVVNTCGFINDAKKESIETIIEMGDYKRGGNLKKLIVTGCLSQRYADDLAKEMPEVDAFCGTGEVEEIGSIIDSVMESNGKPYIKRDNMTYLYSSATDRLLTTFPHTAYIKIAEGCDNKCSYCVIPMLRGKYRSRKIEDIVAEVKNLSEKGVREFNIIAQDTTEYGKDIYGARKLPELLREIAKIEAVKWIRVFYTYPDNFSDDLIEVYKNEEKICKYIDIPIQHINETILKRMNRRGGGKKTRETLAKIRENIPNAVFRTSVIVGFPGETEEQYEELRDFMEEFEFDYAGIFRYSQEEDTVAGAMEEQVDEEIKEERWAELSNLQADISENKNKSLIEKTVEVIVDGVSEESEYMLEGRTRGQALEIDGKVLINDGKAESGDIVKVKIEQNFGYDLLGGIVDESAK